MATLVVDDNDTPILKTWIVSRLEDISDADSDVLADYVLALIKSDDPEDQARANCVENLEDFLKEHTQKFVDDVFRAVREKSYLPGGAPQKPASAAPSAPAPSNVGVTSPFGGPPTGPFNPPKGPSQPHQMNGTPSGRGGGGSGGNQSRKRNRNDFEDNQSQNLGPLHGERNFKQMRRGGPNMRGHRGQIQNGNFGNHQQQQMPQMPGFPFPPNFDPNNPMAAMMAMQAMGMPMPDLNQFNQPQSPQQQSNQQTLSNSKKRCRDYDTKGFCAAGSQCPYEHGDDHIVVGQDAKPSQSSPNFPSNEGSSHSSSPSFRGGRGARGGGRGRGGSHNARGGRAPFSFTGTNNDTRITSIVVENIPEEKFSDEEIRNFFQEFGSIEEINMQGYKRLAIVTFKDHASAQKAYESPKVIFDNRFVKVYWYKPEANEKHNGPHRPLSTSGKQNHQGEQPEDEEMLDPEEFAKKQAEAQRAHEEKVKKLKDAETAKEELDKRIKAQAEERKKLMEKLATKTGGSMASPSPAPDAKKADGSTDASGGNAEDRSGTPAEAKTEAQTAKEKATEALRAKLAELEAEAETLGIGSEESSANTSQHGWRGGRGGFRGGFRGGRGGWRGGYYGAPPSGGAVARLDNRPKSVKVTALDDAVDFSEDAVGEALRGHLYGIGSFASIQPPTEPSTRETDGQTIPISKQRIVTFHERYVAEIFLASPHHTGDTIPGIGKVEMTWVANSAVPAPSGSSPPPPASAPTPATTAKATGKEAVVGNGTKEDHEMSGDTNAQASRDATKEDDWDVADDEEEGRWMMT